MNKEPILIIGSLVCLVFWTIFIFPQMEIFQDRSNISNGSNESYGLYLPHLDINCSNPDSFNMYGIKLDFEAKSEEEYKLFKSPDFIRGYMVGLIYSLHRGTSYKIYPLINTTLKVEECNISYNKVYYDILDLPTEDDCIADNLCFFKIDVVMINETNRDFIKGEM